jgi:hypothetical protein
MIAGSLLLIATAAIGAQEEELVPHVDYPRIDTYAAGPQGFVPLGWRLETQATGDLNRDSRPDLAMVLHMDSNRNRVAVPWDEQRRFDTNPRMLVIAFANPGGGYRLAAADHRLIPRLENPNQDDPFDGISIRRGAVRVQMHLFLSAGGWQAGSTTYTLRWQDGGFKLIGFDRDSIVRNTGEVEEVSINYSTGRGRVLRGRVDSSKRPARSLILPRRPLIDLADLGDGLMFNPDER